MQAVTIVLACFGGLVLLLALSRWLAGRRWACAGHLALAVALLLAAACIEPVAAHLATYQPRRGDAPVAQVHCERTSSRSYRVTLTRLPDGHMQVFEVAGDQWRLEARTLGWLGRAVDLGLRSGFRLDRLSARFVHAAESGAVAPSSYPLSEEQGKDLWAMARAGTVWSDFAVADQATTPWLPLADGARYELQFEQARLAARPINEAAAKAIAAQPATLDSVPRP
ncbi:MAG TPA: hypothetical protein VF277_07480 [Steroidobacteraceae bacterium]